MSYITLDLQILKETDLGVYVTDGKRKEWLPKSLLEYNENHNNKFTEIEMPEWLGYEKGLI